MEGSAHTGLTLGPNRDGDLHSLRAVLYRVLKQFIQHCADQARISAYQGCGPSFAGTGIRCSRHCHALPGEVTIPPSYCERTCNVSHCASIAVDYALE